MLGDLLAAQKDPQAREEVGDIGDDMIADNLIFLWVAAYETTSITLTWVLKLLNDHPDILNRIQVRSSIYMNKRCDYLDFFDASQNGLRMSQQPSNSIWQAEQQEIAQSKDPSAEPAPRLSWEDTRKMVYTQKVSTCLILQCLCQHSKRMNCNHCIDESFEIAIFLSTVNSDPQTRQ